MPKTHVPYPLEVRRQIVELVRTGKTSKELAREFEPTPKTIRIEPWQSVTRMFAFG